MRKKYLRWLLTVLCFSGMLMYGQSGRRSSYKTGSADKNTPSLYVPSDQITVDMSLLRPPVYSVDSRKTKVGSNVPDIFKLWLVNEISFSFSYRPAKRTRPLALEDVKVELFIYASGTSREGTASRWLCGSQTLQCLVIDPEAKTRRYWASLFLPASYVYLYFPQDKAGKYNLRTLEGVVIISDRDNIILGRRAFSYRNKVSSSRAQKLYAAVAELRGKKTSNQIPLWPREKTPWAWLDADRFELPSTDLSDKPQGGGQKQPLPPVKNDDEKEE